MDADDHEAADAAVISLTAGARIAGYRLEERFIAMRYVAGGDAQQFPFGAAPKAVSSVAVRPAHGTARYAFQVTPTLATRYRVELFRSGADSAPSAMPGAKTVYVAINRNLSNATDCGGPVCYESSLVAFAAPPPALKTEMAKTLYMYFGINVAQTKSKEKVPAPASLTLGAGHSAASGEQGHSADGFIVTVTFSYAADGHSYDAAWNVCLKDTVTTDGIGLPGHHGCGDQRIPGSTGYLGCAETLEHGADLTASAGGGGWLGLCDPVVVREE